jgi:hypothetical protein
MDRTVRRNATASTGDRMIGFRDNLNQWYANAVVVNIGTVVHVRHGSVFLHLLQCEFGGFGSIFFLTIHINIPLNHLYRSAGRTVKSGMPWAGQDKNSSYDPVY